MTADAKWTSLRSANFLFIGDAPERSIRRVAQKLEQFREVVSRVVPSSSAAPVPTVVVVFADTRSFRPYMPHFNGRTVEVAGYLVGGDDVAYIALNVEPDFEELAFETVFHEYAHYVTRLSGTSLPPWASEGLAQVWETLQERDGGRSAVVGLAAKHQLDLLKNSTLIPLRQLRSVSHDSPLYNEGSRRSVFYAQSWALMHYLMLADPARAEQLRGYLAAIRRGIDGDKAFSDAFGADGPLEEELSQYVRKFSFPAMKYDFGEKITTSVTQQTEPLDDVEARGYLGDLLTRTGRVEDSRKLLTSVVASQPRAVRAAIALSALDLHEDEPDEAIARLEDLVKRAPDNVDALSLLGRALIEQSDAKGDERLRVRALDVLRRAASSETAPALVVAMLASLELREGGDAQRAGALMERALKSAPGRDEYRLMLAEALYVQRQYDRAVAYLGPLVASGRTPELRDTARRLLGAVATAQAAAQPSVASVAAPQAAAEPAAPAAMPAPPRSSASAGARYILDLRTVGVGETRVLGAFRGIECSEAGVVVLIESDQGPLRLGAERFDQVDFVSYRPEAPGSVTCGALASPVPALATYRAGSTRAGAHGVAIAIELVPDGYVPPLKPLR